MKRGLLLLLAATMALTACATGSRGDHGDPVAPGSAGATVGVSPTPGPAHDPAVKGWAATRRFRGTIVGGRSYLIGRMRWSWRRGCPVDAGRLRLLTVDYWGFDRRVHRGELVVHRDHARRILGVMEKLFNAHYPIRPGGRGPTGPGPGRQ
ncbi:MAG: hypothetical protein ACJ75N_20125 [Actinomycetes bacterium]|jgi:hypothetical protein